MNKQPKQLSIRSFPHAIIHIDGDSFFASCEQTQDPKLKGKAVITGRERGIASSMSYEAKRMGVTRGMSLPEIKKVCPEAILLPSDYELYSLMSVRMYNIVRRYTPDVEEYSIDECFADIKGMRRPLHMSYADIVTNLQKDLNRELGMTFSVGLAPNKVIAKIASKWRKPDGLTIIPMYQAHEYLNKLDIDKIWGIGRQTAAFLNKYQINTALDFAQKDKEWVDSNMTKPHQEIWQELNGEMVYTLETKEKTSYQSISKVKTFSPASKDNNYVFAQLSKNIENACMKARRYKLAPKIFIFFLKTQEFRYKGVKVKLDRPTAVPNDLVEIAKERFNYLFDPKQEYRSTGVVLFDLIDQPKAIQFDLFSKVEKSYKFMKIFEGVDKVRNKHGKHKLGLGSSILAINKKQKMDHQSHSPFRRKHLFMGETARKRVGVPFMGLVQ